MPELEVNTEGLRSLLEGPNGLFKHACDRCEPVLAWVDIRPTERQRVRARMTPFKRRIWTVLRQLTDHNPFVVSLGFYVTPEWTYHHEVFLFECDRCAELSVSIGNGHEEVLVCQRCPVFSDLPEVPDGVRMR